jgi:predicted permease
MSGFAELFIQVAWTVTAPILLLVGLGYILGRAFRLDLGTMTKLNLYALVPALMFVRFTESGATGAEMWTIAGYWSLLILVMWGLSEGFSAAFGLPRSGRANVSVGAMFANTGNFGIPVMDLAFGAAGVAFQAVILAVENVLSFTLGAFLLSGAGRVRKGIMGVLKLPIIYALVAALVFRSWPEWLPPPAWKALHYLDAGLIPLALLTLGAQLGAGPLPRPTGELSLAVVLRLAVAPLAALALVLVFRPPRELAEMLVVAAGFPTAVNTGLLAIEFRRNPRLSSAIVLWTTVLSLFTVTAIIAVVKALAAG